MFAAVSLAVFDSLWLKRKTVAALASESGTSADALERLLDACVGLKVLTKQDGRYANSPEAATYLAASSPHRLTGYITYSNDVLGRSEPSRGCRARRNLPLEIVLRLGRPHLLELLSYGSVDA